MPIDGFHMKPNTMTVRAYDETPKHITGSIEIDLVIKPQLFLVTLQVMDIYPSYNMLLGKPWIHAIDAVASSLH
jgi:hypothetical protein